MFINGNGQISGGPTNNLSGADPNYPLYEYCVTNTISNQVSIIVFRYDPSNLANSWFQQFVAPLPSGPMGSPTYQTGSQALTGNIWTTITPIGGSDLPTPQRSQDSFIFAASNAGASITTGGVTMNGSTSVFPSPGTLAASVNPLPGNLLRCLFFSNGATGAAVGEYYSGGWVCLQWIGSAVTTMTGVTHRLDAVLSTGYFLSTEGGVLRLYDSSGTGTQLYAIPLNGLQFCYEAYVGPTACVFFSLPISLPNNNWIFAVYAIPMSSMPGLEG